MRLTTNAQLVLIALAVLLAIASAKKPSRAASSSRRSTGSGSRRSSGRPPVSKRRYEEEEYEEEEEEELFAFPDDNFEDLEEEEEEEVQFEEDYRRRPSSQRSSPPRSSTPPSRVKSSKRPSGSSRKKPSRTPVVEEYDDGYDRRPPPRRRSSQAPPPPSRRRPTSTPPNRRGSVVPYTRKKQVPGTFTRGLQSLRNSIPDPGAVRDAAVSSLNAARETTSILSSNIYREVKGLTSSELEQVMLKATRPDDIAVKGKHVERLVGVTYQISSRYDIYDAVLRKLWSKMCEKDWRTTIKALYILHRFSADGAPEHAAALKARLRELRRTRDPKRKDKYFNSKQLLSGDARADNAKFRAFMSRYAHYVLLRAQCFGGMFEEISTLPKDPKKKTVAKPMTSTCLRTEHLDAAAMLLKAGIACELREGEECENCAIAVERVASDLIGLTAAVAIALNRALKGDDLGGGSDPVLIKRWCEFYSDELLPETRAMVKRTSTKLDAYGLFLPSRMGASVSQALLQKGLQLDDTETALPEAEGETSTNKDEASEEAPSAAAAEDDENEVDAAAVEEEEVAKEEPAVRDEEEEYEEYEYEDEEYYDDEEPF